MGKAMTADQMDLIVDRWESGSLMDKAVAEAVSLGGFPQTDGTWLIQPEENSRYVSFRPSTDWNDAMLAAEQFGLFTTYGCVVGNGFGCGRHIKEWSCRKPYMENDLRPDVCQFATSGPLAICRAILKLHHSG